MLDETIKAEPEMNFAGPVDMTEDPAERFICDSCA